MVIEGILPQRQNLSETEVVSELIQKSLPSTITEIITGYHLSRNINCSLRGESLHNKLQKETLDGADGAEGKTDEESDEDNHHTNNWNNDYQIYNFIDMLYDESLKKPKDDWIDDERLYNLPVQFRKKKHLSWA